MFGTSSLDSNVLYLVLDVACVEHGLSLKLPYCAQLKFLDSKHLASVD